MKKVYFLFASILLLSFSGNAQSNNASGDTTIHKYPIVSVGTGFVYTSLNFFKNYDETANSRGYSGRIMLQLNDRFRISTEVVKINAVDIPPTWYNLHNTYVDIDGHALMHFRDKRNLAYFILGASAQSWSGFYTGINDLNASKLNIRPNTYYKTLYYGITMGMGVELKVYGPISLYGEFRFRISRTDVGTGLNDVLTSGGIKVNLFVARRKKTKHHSFLKFRDRYHWF
jgi:hypothetical protein